MMKSMMNIPARCFVILVLVSAISHLALAAKDETPKAEECWAYRVGSFATQHGSNKPMEKIDCSGKQYCYIKVKGLIIEGEGGEGKEGAHATRPEYEGGCALPSDPVVQSSGINKNNLPSCTMNKNEGKVICVCNGDECNKMVHIWPYKSLDERLKIRTQAKEDNVWPPQGDPDLPFETIEQENKIMLPAPFSPMK